MRAIRSGITLLAAFGIAWAAPGAGPARGAAPDGVGTDLAEDQRCLACHADVGTAWARLSSHSLLLDCRTCHAVTAPSGKGHAASPACAKCHSQASHPGAGVPCDTCHATHGSANAFLVRESVKTPAGATVAVRVTKPEGASADGLARAGVPGQAAGTGVCEVCHRSTSVYDAAGTGAAHSTRWCGECHRHVDGFSLPLGDAASRPRR